MTCTCKNETLTKQMVCLFCHREETKPLKYSERVAGCPEHHNSIAICGLSNYLCDICQNAGFYVEGGGLGYFQKLTIKNHNDATYNKKLNSFDSTSS